ncbi:MarR family transcriptional regulator [Dyadobacter chenwenxiniae]|uniref:MarR family transcriptional regulator n=1 Tax=Dyadobacter chenwenxiniae TaxID=2906456 RepID=A0A9X1PJ80_9BACT|nr:MarR family transcriptional regulator [Dyadobacter chenwenxiniae]MCF0049393.1 MarR family transcriptional regulator [Dyadobacter chenwenxiniae]MCF0061868.1 MarR family transcriptional regulator [Dyadobacter chenwenxiniae]UON81683.1 MarR family transcriptional regulator [Dyadobacter chenwenxiniae]
MKNSLQFKLGVVTKIVFKKMNAQLVQEGIPVLAEQLPILMVVYFQEHAMTQQDIANVLQKDKAGIQRSVQTLHKDGFLKIESDIEDKRKNLVTLTPSGKFVCERIQALVIAFDNRVMEHFTEEERKTFMGYLDRVAAIAEK